MNDSSDTRQQLFHERLRDHLDDVAAAQEFEAIAAIGTKHATGIEILANLLRDVQFDVQEEYALRISSVMRHTSSMRVSAVPTYGVYSAEIDRFGQRFWWAGSPRVGLTVGSSLGYPVRAKLRLRIGNVPDGTVRLVEVRHRAATEWARLGPGEPNHEFEWYLDLPRVGEEYVELLVDGPACRLESDTRTFFLAIEHLSVATVDPEGD